MKKRKHPGYMIDLGDELNLCVAFFHESISLWSVNEKSTKCTDCRMSMSAGSGMYRKGGSKTGYICLTCAKKTILEKGPRGYTIAGACLQACEFDIGRFSAAKVAAGIERNPHVYQE